MAGEDIRPDPTAPSAEAGRSARALWDVPAVIDLPVRPGDPTAEPHATHAVRRTLTADLAARISGFRVTHACRSEDVLLAGYAATVAFWANQPVFAVAVAVRGPAAGGHDQRGLPVRVAVGDRSTFVDLVNQVRGAAQSAAAADRVAPAVAPAEIGAATGHDSAEDHRPSAQVVFEPAGEAARTDPASDAGAEQVDVDPPIAAAELTLRTERHGARFELILRARRARYGVQDLDELADGLVSLLGAALVRPDAVLSQHPFVPAEESGRLTGQWQGPVYPPPTETTQARIARVAESMPERTAVVGASGSLTYAELMTYARQVARQLHEHGMRDRTVAVCLERDLHWLPAILGIWLAGCVYVPLNTEWPAARMELVLADAEVGCVVVSAKTRALNGLADRPLVVLAPPGGPVAPAPVAGEGTAAYVFYTSGSTGRPKGVLVEHPALGNLLDAMARLVGFGPDDRMLAASAPTFDLSLLEFLLPLTVGATCVVPDDEAAGDPALLGALVAEHRITAVQATPSMWSLLLDQLPGRVPLVLSGGEALSGDLRDHLCRLAGRAFNCYGPTEATVHGTAWELVEGAPVSIGRPLANVRAWVLDHWRRPSPVGAIGELVLGGAGVAREYLNQPDRTAQAFLPGIPGFEDGPVYRTGDLASWGADGQLYLHGRRDNQIKLRGVRIEPGEVESTVRAVHGVRDCAVVAYRHLAGSGLAAFVLAENRPGDTLDADLERAVQTHVAETLPHYTRPQLYFGIDRFPRTSSGKLDRAALAELAVRRLSDRAPARTAATDPMVDKVGEVWREVLGNPAVDGDSHFFSVGGDSLSAMWVVARTNQAFGTRLAILDLVRNNPTLHEFARLVAAGASEAAGTDPAPPARRDLPTLPATSAQRRFAVVAASAGRRLVVPLAFTVARGVLDPRQVAEALGRVADTHPALRCQVVLREDRAVQEWDRDLALGCGYAEIASDGEELAVVRRSIADAERATGDAVPVVTTLVRGPGRDLLLFAFDHAFVDEASLRVFLSGLSAALSGDALATAAPADAWQRYGEVVRGHVALEAAGATPTGVRYWVDKLLPAAVRARTENGHPPGLVDLPRHPGRSHPGSEGSSNVLDLEPVRIPDPAVRPKLFPRLLASLHGALHEVGAAVPTTVGYTWGGRDPDATDVMGCFLNTLVSVGHPDSSVGLDEHAAVVEDEFWDDVEHAQVPFDAVVSAVNQRTRSGWTGNPDALLVFEDLAVRGGVRLAGHDATEWHSPWLQPKAPISLTVQLDGRHLRPRLVRDPARFAERDAYRFGSAWQDRIGRMLRA